MLNMKQQLLIEPGKHERNIINAITSNTIILLNLLEKYHGTTYVT